MENLQHARQKKLKLGSADDQCGPDPVRTLHFLQRWTQIFFREWTPRTAPGPQLHYLKFSWFALPRLIFFIEIALEW